MYPTVAQQTLTEPSEPGIGELLGTCTGHQAHPDEGRRGFCALERDTKREARPTPRGSERLPGDLMEEQKTAKAFQVLLQVP